MNGPLLQDINNGPARPENLTVDFYEEPDALAVHKRRGGGPIVFLSLWFIGWTVGCVVLVGVLLHDPSLGMFAFAIPFWASWIFVAGLLTWMIFGKETVLLRSDKALYQRKALFTLSTRSIPRNEILGFRECRSNHTENDQYLFGIEMVTLGQPIRFAFRLPDREREWLIYQLNRFLGTEVPGSEAAETGSTSDVDIGLLPNSAASRGPSPGSEILTVDRTLAEPPGDCSWQYHPDLHSFSFQQRGRFSFTAVAFMLFVNAFWNGIVTVFILAINGLMPNAPALQGVEWWGAMLFLIPFEVVGLILLIAFVLAALEPIRYTSWRFDPHQISTRNRWAFVGFSRNWPLNFLERLELRNQAVNRATKKPSMKKSVTDIDPNGKFQLAFVTVENADLCVIDDLTEGEARWMAHVIFEQRPNLVNRR